MPTAPRTTCPGCREQVSARAINQQHGVCGGCVRYQRNVRRGYIPPSEIRNGVCLVCDQPVHYQSAVQVLDDGAFRPVHFNCLPTIADQHPAAAQHAAAWYADLTEYHAIEDAKAAELEGAF